MGLHSARSSLYLRDRDFYAYATRKEELAMFDTIILTAGALLPGGVS